LGLDIVDGFGVLLRQSFHIVHLGAICLNRATELNLGCALLVIVDHKWCAVELWLIQQCTCNEEMQYGETESPRTTANSILTSSMKFKPGRVQFPRCNRINDSKSTNDVCNPGLGKDFDWPRILILSEFTDINIQTEFTQY
jgi:hypothetical protein